MQDAHIHPPAPRLGEGLPLRRMPAHSMLGRLGKRVMRPGGFEPSRAMVTELAIERSDDVVEMWPGLERRPHRPAAFGPRSYIGIERGPAEAARAQPMMPSEQRCIVAPVHNTGLPSGCASVVFGERFSPWSRSLASTPLSKRRFDCLDLVADMAFTNCFSNRTRSASGPKPKSSKKLTKVLAISARPLTRSEWRALLEDGGFRMRGDAISPLLLLDPKTVVADESIGGTLVSQLARYCIQQWCRDSLTFFRSSDGTARHSARSP